MSVTIGVDSEYCWPPSPVADSDMYVDGIVGEDADSEPAAGLRLLVAATVGSLGTFQKSLPL